jgi:DnaK suppressor protein
MGLRYRSKGMNVDLPDSYRPSDDEPYLNSRQREYFRQKLLLWWRQLIDESVKISELLVESSARQPDPIDQGTLEAEREEKIRTRTRYITLIHRINDALARINDGTYGYCRETGKEIGIQRLEAQPTATLSLEAQKRQEQMERFKRNLNRDCKLSKGDDIMEDHKIDTLIGIYNEDGSVKCRECMSDPDWKKLKEERIISLEDIERDNKWIYCDYCEERL